ncbi:fucose-1-phosphate guanylyltransferase-like [Oppia nitens]|uniref:fucose-1-phosphate guanylyltransferase-like n=1 Tax=Oppia nitens TaxID=1686743 RepID=UPI0023DAD745|nr:fucose-1-phosphate guanylyltransferase-like [Oppia nitens]
MKSSRDLLKQYNDNPISGWDLIVISSRDERQRSAFERQLDEMKQNNRHFITDEFNFLVVSDEQFVRQTNGTKKLGSGGSTLFIFRYLLEQFGDNYISNHKILLIHSGGYSQRLPHYSILGKLFSNLPIELNSDDNKYWTALDVKLALLAPFATLMSTGVWITASDDIVIYSYDESEMKNLSQFASDSIVCLGHPSDVDISVTHGVYVLDDQTLPMINSRTVSMHNCLQVLQKPTVDELTKFGAFVLNGTLQHCITDSSYYLGSDVIVDRLLKYPVHSLDEELDCYGHFLCPLGSDPVSNYGDNKFKSPLNQLLSDVHFKVLVLSQSKFIHLGTIGEYIYEMTDYSDKELAKSLCFRSQNHSDSDVIKGTVICSQINVDSVVDRHSVVEFCNFADIPIVTNRNLLYNCILEKRTDRSLEVLKFPVNYLLYSVPVTIDDGVNGWCTLGCCLDSQLKSELWSSNIFPVCETNEKSLLATLELIDGNFNDLSLSTNVTKLSMSSVKDWQNTQLIVEMRLPDLVSVVLEG